MLGDDNNVQVQPNWAEQSEIQHRLTDFEEDNICP